MIYHIYKSIEEYHCVAIHLQNWRMFLTSWEKVYLNNSAFDSVISKPFLLRRTRPPVLSGFAHLTSRLSLCLSWYGIRALCEWITVLYQGLLCVRLCGRNPIWDIRYIVPSLILHWYKGYLRHARAAVGLLNHVHLLKVYPLNVYYFTCGLAGIWTKGKVEYLLRIVNTNTLKRLLVLIKSLHGSHQMLTISYVFVCF